MHVSDFVSSKEVKKQSGRVRVGGGGAGDPGFTFEKGKAQGAGVSGQLACRRSPATAVIRQTLISTALRKPPELAPPMFLNLCTGPQETPPQSSELLLCNQLPGV